MVTNTQRQYQQEAERALASGIPPPSTIRDSRNRVITNPAYTIYQNTINTKQKAEAAAQAIQEAGVSLKSPGRLDRTVADFVAGKSNTSSFNINQKRQLAIVELNRDTRAGIIPVTEYQARLDAIENTFSNEQSQRSFQFAERAKKGLENAALAERQRFANIAITDFAAQETAQTAQLQKVSNTLTNAGFDPKDLQQAKGKPNPNAILKINTPAERKQSDFAKQQVSRPVSSVLPDYGVNLFDSKGNLVAKNVKQTGNFTFAEKGKNPKLTQAIISSSGSVLGTITGKSPKSEFNILEITKQSKSKTLEYQGPQKQNYLYDVTLSENKKPNYNYIVNLSGKQDPMFQAGSLDFLFRKKQDVSEKYGLDNITFENVFRGFYEGGVLPTVQAILAPKPIFTDIFGRTEAENKALGKTVKKIEKLVPAGPVASGYVIEQAITGKPITGTGEGLGYDVGSIGFDVASALIPSKKGIPLGFERATIPTLEGTEVLASGLRIGIGKASTRVITKVGNKITLGSGKNLVTVENVAKIKPSAGIFEVATAKPLAQDLLLSDTGLKALQDAGRITGLDVDYYKASKELAKIAELGLKKIPAKDFQKAEILPRGTVSGLETVAEEEKFIEDIVPKLRPEKGSQLIPTQIDKDLIPSSLQSLRSDKDIDYLAGLRGEKYATTQALKRTAETVQSLNDVMLQQRGAAAKGSKVFTGIVEGVVFNPPKLKSNQFVRGDLLENLYNIKYEGFDLSKAGSNVAKRFRLSPKQTKDRLGIEGIYLTKDPDYAATYAETAIGKTKINPIVPKEDLLKGGLGIFEVKKGKSIFGLPITKGAKILDFNQIEKNVVANLRRQFPEFGDYQKSLIDLAKSRGFQGITKPIKASPVGRVETVIFDPKNVKLKQIVKPSFKLKNEEKVFELLTSDDTDKGINSVLNVADRVYGVKSKSRKVVKIPTGYKKFGLKQYDKQITAAQQLLNNLASGSRIQYKITETPYKNAGKIPFIKEGFEGPIYTDEGFRVGSDLHRFKDIVRSEIFAKQTARLLEKRGYVGKIAEVDDIYKRIKIAKPEIEFFAPFNKIENKAEYADIESLASFVGNKAKSIISDIAPTAARTRPPTQESPKPKRETKSISSIVEDSLDSISSSRAFEISSRIESIGSRARGSSRSSSPSIFDSYSSLGKISISKSTPSPSRKPSKSPSRSPSKSPSKSPVYNPVDSPYTPPYTPPYVPPSSPPSRYSSRVNPTKINLPIIKPTALKIKLAPFLLKFNQVKNRRLPSRAKRKFFIADIADPKRPGVAFTAGVRTLRSSKSNVFQQIDRDLRKARNRRGTFDPLAGLNFGKKGKGLLNSSVRIRI